MARTIRILSVDEFKKLVNTTSIHIKLGTSGSYYATDSNSKRIASVAPDVMEAIANKVPLTVLELEDLGDRWFMIVPQRDHHPDLAVI